MNRRIQTKALIGQEKRAANLFMILLLSVVFLTDLVVVSFLSNGYGWRLLTPYFFLYLQIPLAIIFLRKQNPRYIKYMLFITFISICFMNEVFLFWGTESYEGGSVAEMFFILFSPIFINKRYCWTVTIGIVTKYCLEGIILNSTVIIMPLAINLIFALVAFIFLYRFRGFIKAMNESYFKQFEVIVKGIVSTLELKDPYTRGHSDRVAEYAGILAESLEIYNEDDLKLIHYACLLHDIGKVHTPDFILIKPTKLNEEEFEIVKQHPIVGADAIKDIEGMELCLDIVLYHHERWDGKGYPEGLKGMQIPLTARIAAIADCFDAMTSQRSYRAAMSVEQAYEQIILGAESQFDPALIEYFKKIFPTWTSIVNKKRELHDSLLQVAVTINH